MPGLQEQFQRGNGIQLDRADFYFCPTFHLGANISSHLKVGCLHVNCTGNLILEYRWQNPCLHNIYSATISLSLPLRAYIACSVWTALQSWEYISSPPPMPFSMLPCEHTPASPSQHLFTEGCCEGWGGPWPWGSISTASQKWGRRMWAHSPLWLCWWEELP